MAIRWQPQPIDVYVSWYTAVIDEASDQLNDWEMNFIESIGEQLRQGRNLSEKQAEKLENIYAKHTN
jgi:hypothetical protein